MKEMDTQDFFSRMDRHDQALEALTKSMFSQELEKNMGELINSSKITSKDITALIANIKLILETLKVDKTESKEFLKTDLNY